MKTFLLTITTLLALTALPFLTAAEEEKAKPYPLKVCIVTGEKLGSMGEPASFVYEGQEIKLCCSHCKPRFDKDPAKHLKKLDESEKAE